ncbi:MAG: tRNA pseudouridine(38-40) synthase TruA [Gammaproteobacteria bacterium]|nr:tRNA pseudouridine(38-40) synthase TruA [Gammaproteobacteria bacterium]
MRIAMGVEYAGTAFAGWQLQDGVRTVQGCVEQALATVADHPVRVFCAGRTDAGVHASGQVIHFDSEALRSPRAWVFGANAHLPPDVAMLWAQPVSDEFHARYSAFRRSYRYVIFNRPIRPSWQQPLVSWVYRPLDAQRMQQAADALVGEHDFSSFRAYACQAKSPVRTVYRLQVQRHGDLVLIDIEANAFLHHMVRNIAGVLIAIGGGEQPAEWAAEVLQHRDRQLGGVTAVPDGLYLCAIEYPPQFAIPLTMPAMDLSALGG